MLPHVSTCCLATPRAECERALRPGETTGRQLRYEVMTIHRYWSAGNCIRVVQSRTQTHSRKWLLFAATRDREKVRQLMNTFIIVGKHAAERFKTAGAMHW